MKALTRTSPSPHETPTEWSAGLQPALRVRARYADCKSALRSRDYEVSGLTLTKDKIEKAIALEETWSEYLVSTRTPDEADLGLDYQSDKWRKQLREDEKSQPCKNLKKFLRTLSDQEFRELKVFMWIGRGEYKPAKFHEICDETSVDANREADVSYLIEKMEAANYFRDGFEKLNIARII